MSRFLFIMAVRLNDKLNLFVENLKFEELKIKLFESH